MKKFISSALALTLIASVLAGCSSNTASTSDPGSAPESSTPSSQVESNIQEEQTNTEKALALIGTFASGDTETARELLDENYIQHNLAYGTGEDAFIGSVEYLASADGKTTVENIRSFEDGDYVFLQTAALAAEPNPSGHTQIDGTMEVTDLDKTEENRELVKNFLYDVMQGNNPDKTADYFDGDTYIQHNTAIADGVSGLNAALTALAEQGIQMIYDETRATLSWRSAKEPTAAFPPATTTCGVWRTARLPSIGMSWRRLPISPPGRTTTANSD